VREKRKQKGKKEQSVSYSLAVIFYFLNLTTTVKLSNKIFLESNDASESGANSTPRYRGFSQTPSEEVNIRNPEIQLLQGVPLGSADLWWHHLPVIRSWQTTPDPVAQPGLEEMVPASLDVSGDQRPML
jgi:hypothetical protein